MNKHNCLFIWFYILSLSLTQQVMKKVDREKENENER